MSSMKLVIVGGVAGGATAAARARRLSEDAEILMLERGPHVSFANCGLPYHVGGEIADRAALLLQTPEGLHTRYNIDVRVRSEVLSIDRTAREVAVRNRDTNETYRLTYDKLLLSPGAAPIRPPLPGIDHERIFTLRNVPDTDHIKAAVDAGAQSALVVGAGFIGLEMAENLCRRGLDVHVVELLDQVMPPLDKEMTTIINQTLAQKGVRLTLGDAVESFSDTHGRVRATLKSGKTITTDLVVLAVGVKPESKLAGEAGLPLNDRGAIVTNDRMQTSDPDIYAVGDAVAVNDFVTGDETLIPLAGPANRQARIAVDNIFGRDSTFRGAQGTSIVRVFDIAAASTGASEKVLRRRNANYEKIYIHPHNHAGYFPGAAPLTIKLLFDRDNGRVLGAQITGNDGVDKRIDILATAIQASMTVHDLEEVELAYAPQYGSAKDPINMAGFVAANTLRGDVDTIHADQLNDIFVLDVRDPDEFDAGAVPGAALIPLPELRNRYTELPRDRTIACYCQAGLRGYIAARILAQLGYQVRNISGGYKTYCAYHPANDEAGCPPIGSADTDELGVTIMPAP
jgi:NADPH-dependent 2,4-dienoyl-CoA reductase/sulfur reductase-like enzyme/rhodanese-related sulfurtransferase